MPCGNEDLPDRFEELRTRREIQVTDSTGLSCLVRIHHQSATTGAHLMIANLSATLRRWLAITGLDQLLNATPAP